MDILTQKKPGRKPKFSLLKVSDGPIKAKGYTKTFPHQYARYWNKRHPELEVRVVFNKKDEPFFELKPVA